jgi:hypothetical protein
LLGSDLETDNATTFAARQQIFNEQVYAAVAGWRLRGQARSHGDDWGNSGRVVFCTRSVPRGCKSVVIQSQAACRQDELVGGKPPVGKVTFTLTLCEEKTRRLV